MAGTLATYNKKRDFKTTAEPRGRKAKASGQSFVIQKHDARRLHYDFRLEMDGVLKSWAVTRGPSLVPGEKRLAVHVEDHPLEYGSFEGTIPKGEYGGGTVIVWDRGTWSPIYDVQKMYAKGHLEFTLEGEKLHGRWHLVRMHGKPREKRENWLLIKAEDEVAREPGDPDILEEFPDSVKTGRAIADVENEAPGWSSKTGKIDKKAVPAQKKALATKKIPATKASVAKPAKRAVRKAEPESEKLNPASLKGAKKAALPDFVEPALATLAAKPPADGRYLHEIKFDGYRLQVRIEGGRLKLLTRSGLDWTKKFGKEIVAALLDLPAGKALIDGELVVESETGASDFSSLQADISEGRADRFVFYAFDLLHLDGYDLQAASLIERKALLEQLLADAGPRIRYSAHFEEGGDMVLRHACRLSLEGVVSKLRDAPYRSGRGKGWIKSKCSSRQEFVIGGYVPSTVSKRAIGSLVLGVYDGKKLNPVGRVGTGFTAAVAEDLFKRLDKLRTDASPFTPKLAPADARGVRFVRPERVAEVEYRAWTAAGSLRHASFRGLREDKPAIEIVREDKIAASTAKPGKAGAKAPAAPKANVRLTHPDRVYWPDEGVTKEGLADYYSEVWKWIAPFVVGRPLALLRCPSGINGQQFFQKHAWKGLNPNIRLVNDPKPGEDEPFIAIDNLDGLIGLVQSAVLEIHPWGSTMADWDWPDMITMDLDPGEGTEWQAVIDGAREVRKRLKDAGLESFVKTSGGKGLHVVAPLKPDAGWPEVKAFTKAMADAMAADSPDLYVSTIAKSKRPGKILIDYLRNQRGMTAVSAYSTRARPGASVSMPLDWSELSEEIRADHFTLMNAPARLAALKRNPWADFRSAAAVLKVGKSAKSKKAR